MWWKVRTVCCGAHVRTHKNTFLKGINFFFTVGVYARVPQHMDGWSDDNPWGNSVLTFHHVGAGNEILS